MTAAEIKSKLVTNKKIMSKNSLSSLLGSYMSDSENDENGENKTNSFSKEVDNLLDEIGENGDKSNLPTTSWTQCMDPKTGHPYYWNISTKEVTWEKPEEYEKYLAEITTKLNRFPDDCWVLGSSEDTNTSYYVNEFTRVVSWEKPKNFKDNKKSKKNSVRLKKPKKVPKKSKLTDHLETGSDEDVKVDLSSSYCARSNSNSGDEKTKKKPSKKTSEALSKVNLVAAYAASDDESDPEVKDRLSEEQSKTNSKESRSYDSELQEANDFKSKSNHHNKNVITATSIENMNNEQNNETNTKESSVSPEHNTNSQKPFEATSFASIITGGKLDNSYDKEFNKLKEELEKDLEKIDSKPENSIPEQVSNVENSFDEKTFQRKRRIEFKTNQIKTITNENSDSLDNPKTSLSVDDENSKNNSENKKTKNLYANFQRSHVEFVKNDNENPCDNKKDIIKEENDEMKDNCNELSETIAGKVKFLCVGYENVSTVQAMSIQLETLLAAFRSSALSIEYFFKWLKLTSDDLLTLEKNVAPVGWSCKWDRESSRYCYENIETHEIQWEFPKIETDHKNDEKNEINSDMITNDKTKNKLMKMISEVKAKEFRAIEVSDDQNFGEDEMDISTTPPPNEHEQIIMNTHIPLWDTEHPPPPPIITNLSSSPQTIIYQSDAQFISNELASFYSDIANLETTPKTDCVQTINSETVAESIVSNKKRIMTDDPTLKKKRKKVKVQGLGMRGSEVSNMVAKWQKAQKELTD